MGRHEVLINLCLTLACGKCQFVLVPWRIKTSNMYSPFSFEIKHKENKNKNFWFNVTLKGKKIKQLLNGAGSITAIGGDPNKIQLLLPDSTYIPKPHFQQCLPKSEFKQMSSVDCCAGQNIPFVPLKNQKNWGRKPNKLTEEILALCNPYFIPCPPEHRSSCKKDERERNWMCEIYSLWGPGSDLGSESGQGATCETLCVRWISWSRSKKILVLISAKLSLFPWFSHYRNLIFFKELVNLLKGLKH